MSDETNTDVKAEVLTDVPKEISKDEKHPQIIDKGQYTLEQKFFSGAKAGFSYFVLQFKSGNEEESNASLETMLKRQGWNAKTIVDLVNSQIVSATRAKANNTLAFDEEGVSEEEITAKIKEMLVTEPCLVTPEKAEQYVPGERDIRTIGGKLKLIGELSKEIKDSKTTAERKKELLEQVTKIQLEVMEEIQKMSKVETQEVSA